MLTPAPLLKYKIKTKLILSQKDTAKALSLF